MWFFFFSIKARAMIHAHLLRIDLPAETLLKDKNVVVKKAPFLINEMVNVVSNLVASASQMPKNFHPPQLDTLENIMRLSPMIVQALWDKNKKQTLLQLPHLQEGHLRHFQTKKRNINDIKQFAQMNEEDRRSIVRHLTDEQYQDVMRVCASYPLVNMDVKTEVFDDEDEQIITTGAIVTVVVKLKRQNMSVLFEKGDAGEGNDEENAGIEVEELVPIESSKPTNNQPKKNGGNNKGHKKQPNNSGKAKNSSKTGVALEQKTVEKSKEKVENGSDSEGSEKGSNEDGEAGEPSGKKKSGDEYFEKFQQIQKKKESLETKDRISHRVYCPYFPVVSCGFHINA
jgi:translocation protein SEC63